MQISNRSPFDVTLETLAARKSEKWSTYGRDVLPAFVAEMDFGLAASVAGALHEAIDAGDCGYAGIEELVPAFCRFARHRFDWPLDAERVFALPDVMAGVSESLRALTAPGCGVVINPPVYPPFFEVIGSAGRSVVEVPLKRAQARWDLDFEALERSFSRQDVGAYLLCNPHNPVGRAWSHDDLARIARMAHAHGVLLIGDEIHGPLVLEGARHVPLLAVTSVDQPCIALTSASKAWNVAGLKCAVAIAGSEPTGHALANRLNAIPTDVRWRIGHLGAIASTAAFLETDGWLDALTARLSANRALLAQLLRDRIPEAICDLPEATYLAWIDCRPLKIGSNPSQIFLERGHVALESGLKFGKEGAGFVRLNFATSPAILEEIVNRMSVALKR